MTTSRTYRSSVKRDFDRRKDLVRAGIALLSIVPVDGHLDTLPRVRARCRLGQAAQVACCCIPRVYATSILVHHLGESGACIERDGERKRVHLCVACVSPWQENAVAERTRAIVESAT